MKKSQFKEKYGISDLKPLTISRHPLFCADIANTTGRFIEDNFKGLCEVTSFIPFSTSYVIISEEQLVCFFRELLECVYGKNMIKIAVEMDEDYLNIVVTAEGELPIECLDANSLVRRAKLAGFKVELSDTTLRLYIKHRHTAHYKVYAISKDQLYGMYSLMFFGPKVYEVPKKPKK